MRPRALPPGRRRARPRPAANREAFRRTARIPSPASGRSATARRNARVHQAQAWRAARAMDEWIPTGRAGAQAAARAKPEPRGVAQRDRGRAWWPRCSPAPRAASVRSSAPRAEPVEATTPAAPAAPARDALPLLAERRRRAAGRRLPKREAAGPRRPALARARARAARPATGVAPAGAGREAGRGIPRGRRPGARRGARMAPAARPRRSSRRSRPRLPPRPSHLA